MNREALKNNSLWHSILCFPPPTSVFRRTYCIISILQHIQSQVKEKQIEKNLHLPEDIFRKVRCLKRKVFVVNLILKFNFHICMHYTITFCVIFPLLPLRQRFHFHLYVQRMLANSKPNGISLTVATFFFSSFSSKMHIGESSNF